jgi:membrane protein
MPGNLFLERLYREYQDDSVSDSAAALSYYFMFSLFPFLFFLVTLAAFIPPVRESIVTLLDRGRALVPPQAMSLVDAHVRGIVAQPRPRLLTIGLVVTLYTASRGVDALRKALNRAYGVKETRPLWQTELIAMGVTVVGSLVVLAGVAALVAGGDLGLWAAARLGVANHYVRLWSWLRWPFTSAVIATGSAVAYQILPDVAQRFRLVTPGSVMGTAAWLAATWGFDQYASHFGRYNVTYGALGGVIVLLTWCYITGFVFLMGGEVNAIFERHRARERLRARG